MIQIVVLGKRNSVHYDLTERRFNTNVNGEVKVSYIMKCVWTTSFCFILVQFTWKSWNHKIFKSCSIIARQRDSSLAIINYFPSAQSTSLNTVHESDNTYTPKYIEFLESKNQTPSLWIWVSIILWCPPIWIMSTLFHLWC